jgi:hypothetical protein
MTTPSTLRHAGLVGGGIAALAAVDLIRHGDFAGERIDRAEARQPLCPARPTLLPAITRARGPSHYSTVTLLARLRGLSTSVPRATAVW